MGNFFSDYKEKKAAEDAEMRKKNPDRLPTKFQVVCRMVVGVYLLYLVYKLIKDGAITKTSGVEQILMIAAVVLFAVVGVFCFIKALKAYKNGKFFDPNKDDFSEEGKAEMEAERVEEEKKEAAVIEANGGVKPGSMASFAKLTSASEVSAEEQDEAYEAAKAANEAEGK